MSAGVLLDATPIASAHALRGIGAAMNGLLSGFAELPEQSRPRLLLRRGQTQRAGFTSRAVRWPRWRPYRVPDPWPLMVGERLLKYRDESIFHATQPALVPPGPRVVVTLYDLIPACYPEHYLTGRIRGPQRRAYHHFLKRVRSAALVIAISRETADDAMRLLDIPATKIRVVPLGRSEPVAPAGEIPSEPYVLYSGALEHHKNVGLLIDALSLTAAPIRLVATGAWSSARLARLERRARGRGVASRIEWRGHVPSAELEALRRGAIAQLVPSLKEGFGLPVLEAMTSGTAVLCANILSLREVGGDAAEYLPIDDPHAWADHIDRHGRDRDLSLAARERGYARAQQFSWKECATASLDAYESLGAGHTR